MASHSHELVSDLAPGRAYFVRRNRRNPVQIAWLESGTLVSCPGSTV
ncbi:MAG TPA: hypothetical protein VKV40_17750 [Ktedonobacteraceae bacterium]|nr:hypothetical protein [Ktedonobacteraceae bacterium]